MMNLVSKLFTDGFIYLFIYLWLFFIAVLESCKEYNRYKIVFASFTFILLSLFTGSRWNTGTDWGPYKELFDTLELDWTFLLNVYSFDLGYVLLNAFVKLFTNSYTMLLLVDSFLAVGIVFAFLIKYSPNPNVSFFVFYNAFFVSQFMGSNRRIISLGAALFIFYYVYANRKKGFVIWQTIAFLFHRSAFMIFFTWLIPRKRLSTERIFIILIVSLMIGIPQLPFKMIGLLGNALSAFAGNPIVEKMLFYSDEKIEIVVENTNPVIIMTLSVIKRSIFLSFYLLIIRSRKGILDPLSDYFFNLYIFGFAVYILLNGSPIFQMISTYFTFIEIALIGRFWYYANKRPKIIFLSVLFLYGFFQLLSALNAYPDLYIPYKAFFY